MIQLQFEKLIFLCSNRVCDSVSLAAYCRNNLLLLDIIIIIIIGCPSISKKAVLSWITGVSFPPSFQVLLFSLSFNGVTSIKDLFPPKRLIFGITLPRVYIHVSCLQMTLQNIFVMQLLPTTFPFSRRQFTVEDS